MFIKSIRGQSMNDFENEDTFTSDIEITDDAVKEVATGQILDISSAEILSKEECEDIIKSCIDELWMPVKPVGDLDIHNSSRQKLKGDTEGFPFENIKEITKKANNEIYDFKLLGIIDQDYPQVFRYQEKEYQNYHLDITPMSPTRKLTFILILNNKNDKEGGNIEFLNTEMDENTVTQGTILIFPSFLPYQITPVTKGEAHFVIGHVHGALFR